ncbi:MAG: hypothetical protein HRU26_05565 [Psychroserpens sp.]|nr:hypothetical protein [Psychroserpens sp.]
MAFLKMENLNVKPKTVKLDEGSTGKHVFQGLLNEIFEEFGVNKELEEELKIKKSLAKAYLEYSISGDRSLLNAVNIHKKKLEDLLRIFSESVVKFGDEMAIVSKSLGAGMINPKETTVQQYYSAKTLSNNG